MSFAELITSLHREDDDGLIDTRIDTHARCVRDKVIVYYGKAREVRYPASCILQPGTMKL